MKGEVYLNGVSISPEVRLSFCKDERKAATVGPRVRITVAGLGPGHPGQIPLLVWEVLQQSGRILLRTGQHPVVPWLRKQGVVFTTFDHLYEAGGSFQEVYRQIAAAVLEEAGRGPLVYAVPGNPLVAEKTVELILQKAPEYNLGVEILPAMSFLDAVYVALRLDPAGGLYIVDGSCLEGKFPQPGVGNIIIQVYNRLVISDVKLFLMNYYPFDHPVVVVQAAGVPGLQRIEEHPLYCIDRLEWIDHLTSLYVPPCEVFQQSFKTYQYPLDPLVEIMAVLRSEDGCPWDREQTHLTLRKYLLEEAYEVIEAIERADAYKICEELGDLLLQIVFHARLAGEKGLFDINDVVVGITRKMRDRHPHVFGDVVVANSAEVEFNWEKIKRGEKGTRVADSILGNVPQCLPAMLRAGRVQARAAKVGFDWPDYQGAMKKIDEELGELAQAIADDSPEQVEAEVGDLFFAAVNLSRLLGVEAEIALAGAVNRFISRFRYIEEQARSQRRELSGCTLKELDDWWEEAKKVEKVKKK
ncbi:MAG TPA: nucleoside triphosphate pyrophosphohydrolase [Desulfotomaculum sp.]|jgi:tetrapyrrole methylase family protein/MazG family protein|nr:nucleoside triphosphate pyrophosphohydrolase [Desulfotomaculum sp.]